MTTTSSTETLNALVRDFLSQQTIAIVGISGKKETPANGIYKKMKSARRTVIPVHPHLESFDGDRCYPDLLSIPAVVGGVFIAAKPSSADDIVEQCIQKQIPRLWMHHMGGILRPGKTSGMTSVSHAAAVRCKENNITVIAGACPMMFLEPVDGFHACVKFFLSMTGKLRLQ